MKIDSIIVLDWFIQLMNENNVDLSSICIKSSKLCDEIQKSLAIAYQTELDQCKLHSFEYRGVRIERDI